ncbi:U4/U6 small nuclear ribonucleoprotein PRP4 [Bienertia sinuspersici]
MVGRGMFIIRFSTNDGCSKAVNGGASNLNIGGESTLFKLASLVGDPVKLDQATSNKDRMNYARVLIEISLNQELPKIIEF